ALDLGELCGQGWKRKGISVDFKQVMRDRLGVDQGLVELAMIVVVKSDRPSARVAHICGAPVDMRFEDAGGCAHLVLLIRVSLPARSGRVVERQLEHCLGGGEQ